MMVLSLWVAPFSIAISDRADGISKLLAMDPLMSESFFLALDCQELKHSSSKSTAKYPSNWLLSLRLAY